MSFIAMSTNNPLGKRPYQQMGSLTYDMEKAQRSWIVRDFPGAPTERMRTPPELLGGNAAKQNAIHPPAIVEQASPWDAAEPVMLLGTAAVTSTQTVVPTQNTTPVTTGVVASGQAVWSAWFSQQTMIPGLSNWEVIIGGIAAIALFKAFK